MLRRLKRYVSTTSESSEDDISHPKRQVRMPVSNVQVRQFSDNQPYSTGRNSSSNKSKNPSNGLAPYLTRLRTRIPPSSNSDKSSTSETDDFEHPPQRKSLRVSSDYDTGTRSDEANDTNSDRILNSLSLRSDSVQNNASYDCSSDDSSSIQTRSLKRRKTSVINLDSSTDSSDSGVPSQVGRASGKRTRLRTSSDSSSSTYNSSNENSDENNINAFESTMENESMSNLFRDSPENNRRRTIGERSRRIQRLTAIRQNRIPAPRQSRPSSSRQNSITATSENSIPRTSRQTHRRPSSSENYLRPNTIQLRSNRPVATTSATSQNPVPNTGRPNNRRSGARVQNNITITLPRYRQSVRQPTVNSQNPSSASSSNRQRNSRPTTSRQIDTRTVVNRHNNVRPPVTRARQNNRRTSTNGESVGRTATNSTVISDPDTGFSLRISIRNGENITYVRNPLTDSRVRLDTDSSSGSSSDDMRPVLRQRRVIFSSDNNTTSSDSEASSVFLNRARRRVQLVVSDNESAEESRTQPVATSKKIHHTVLSDSDGETEKCPICFGRFEQQEVGTPKTCEHCFCLECIKKWAENNNTCPVDRRTFNSIVVRASVQGEVIREDVVPPPNYMALLHSDDSFLGSFSDSVSDTTDDLVFFGGLDSDYDVLDLDTHDYDGPDEICTVCTLGNDAEEMLPCDACDNVYHLQCVDPPLQAIPVAWICPDCVQSATVD